MADNTFKHFTDDFNIVAPTLHQINVIIYNNSLVNTALDFQPRQVEGKQEDRDCSPTVTNVIRLFQLGFPQRCRTHFSRPSPATAILLLSSVHAISLTLPEKGMYSYFSRCSFWVVSQIRTFPDTSKRVKNTNVFKDAQIILYVKGT